MAAVGVETPLPGEPALVRCCWWLCGVTAPDEETAPGASRPSPCCCAPSQWAERCFSIWKKGKTSPGIETCSHWQKGVSGGVRGPGPAGRWAAVGPGLWSPCASGHWEGPWGAPRLAAAGIACAVCVEEHVE